ncbi:MAG TPA: hypothetical protein VKA65_07585 [Acidimicrobiales bacterium]|nr:hypothetical protein [Acidimicrobiales bacterium]
MRRLVRWLRARRAKPCPSRAPVADLDGLGIHDLYRWQTRCELPAGHAGRHRGEGVGWD